MCEPMQNADLLFKAADAKDSAERMAYLIAFIAAGYSYATRNKKPFNPILGETFEYLSKDNKWKFFAEQVSHHPPIGISEASCDAFLLNLEMSLKTNFRGNSSEVYVTGTNHCKFPKTDDEFSWNHLETCAHNIIIGSMWVDHFGTLQITNHKTKEVGIIKFNRAGFFGSGRWEIAGEIKDETGQTKMLITGKWNGQIFATRITDGKQEEPKILWEKEKPYPNKWNFPSQFTESLNELSEEYRVTLPANDSRLRGDRFWLEHGDNEKAGKEKHRLEEKQRSERKERELKQEEYHSKYFKKEEQPDKPWKDRWVKVRDYWQDREDRMKSPNASTSAPKEETTKPTEFKPISTGAPKEDKEEIPIEKLSLNDVNN